MGTKLEKNKKIYGVVIIIIILIVYSYFSERFNRTINAGKYFNLKMNIYNHIVYLFNNNFV